MSYTFRELRDVALAVETTYGVSVSGSAAYESLPHLVGAEIGVGSYEMLPRNHARQKKFDRSVSQPGLKNEVSVSLPMHLEGARTPLSGAASAGLGPAYGKVLRTIVGGFHADQGSSIATGTSSGSFSVAASEGSRFKAGQILGCVNPSTGKLEAAQVREVDTDDIELITCLEHTPGSGAAVYNGYNYHLIQNPTGSMQILATGHGENSTWVVTGLQGNFGFTLELGQLPVITFDLEGADWHSGSSGSAIRKSFNDLAIPVFSDSRVLFYPSDSSEPIQASPVAFSGLTITPNLSWVNVRSAHGVQTIARKALAPTPQDQGAMAASITLYFEDRSQIEALEKMTEFGLLVQVGSQPGNTWVLSMPRCQIVSTSLTDANDDLEGIEVTLASFHNSYCVPSAGYEELAEAPFVIASL